MGRSDSKDEGERAKVLETWASDFGEGQVRTPGCIPVGRLGKSAARLADKEVGGWWPSSERGVKSKGPVLFTETGPSLFLDDSWRG